MAERWQEIEGDLWTEVEDAAVNAGRDEFGVDASDIVEPACKRIAALEAEVERLTKERDEAREMCEEELGWMGGRCPSCGHRFRFSADHCPQCHKPIPAPWKYPETMPDTCDCERCVEARKALKGDA